MQKFKYKMSNLTCPACYLLLPVQIVKDVGLGVMVAAVVLKKWLPGRGSLTVAAWFMIIVTK
jgi:hypothetical protein